MTTRTTRINRRNLPLLLLQAREAIFARFRPILNEENVTEQQWRVVRALLENGPLEPHQICEICCLSSPSLAGILARMDQQGWVSRERIQHDQRRVLVSVSQQGEALATRLAPKIESVYADLEIALGERFTSDLYLVLDRVMNKLAK